MLENTWQDFRYGIRNLLRNPGFTIVAGTREWMLSRASELSTPPIPAVY